MTDNRTTELLREGLTERGIEWRSGLEGVTFVGDWCFVEYENGKLAATCEPALTPEQAIAATLGNDKKLITIALQLVRDHYCYPEQFDESCIELERWCYDHGETDLMEYAMALRCPACAFVPMDDGRSTSHER